MTRDELTTKYCMDAPSKKELDKYSQFMVIAEGMDGKLIRLPKSKFDRYEDAIRSARALQKPTTHHLFIEGSYENGQVNPKAVYEWRNRAAKR